MYGLTPGPDHASCKLGTEPVSRRSLNFSTLG